jgi:hypothetical protein
MEDSVGAMVDSAGAMGSLRPSVGSMAGTPLAEAALSTATAGITEVAGITAAEDITAVEDTTAPALDSVSAFTRLTDMRLRSAIPQDSTMQTACGNIIRVALYRTDIKVDGRVTLKFFCRPNDL